MIRRILFTLVALTLVPSAFAVAGEGHMDFSTAQKMAQDRQVLMVVDFFADWCGPCKRFDAALADAESGIATALEGVVFTSIDAEKGEGIELAKKYTVDGFPTYMVLNAEGEVVDRWSGYGDPSHFIESLDGALADPTTMAEKRVRFEKEPTAELARKFATAASAEREYEKAIALYRQAESLEEGADESMNILYTAFGAVRRQAEGFGFDRFDTIARETALREGADPQVVIMAAQLMGAVAGPAGHEEAQLPYLEAALEIVENTPEAVDEGARESIRIDGLLKIRKDADAAVAAKRATMPEGWQEDTQSLNSFAWWCFENEVNLEEAEQLARRGIEVATDPATKASVADTAAEICNLRGDCRDAVTLIELAIAEDPDNDYYAQQLERFQKILASGE